MININTSATVGLAGYFKLEVEKPDGSIKELAPFQKNLILDQGLDANAYKDYCHIGTGTSTPVVTQTGLDALVAIKVGGAAGGNTNSGAEPYYTDSVRIYSFAVGAFNGEALAEIGLGGPEAASLWSRSLIKDVTGTPTTVTVLSDEILKVTYTIRITPPTADSVAVLGAYTCTTRPANVNNAAGWYVGFGNGFSAAGSTSIFTNASLGPTTGSIGGSSIYGISGGAVGTATLVGVRTGRFSQSFGVGDINTANGISGWFIHCSSFSYQWQVLIDPPIMKTSTDILTITHDTTWDRA